MTKVLITLTAALLLITGCGSQAAQPKERVYYGGETTTEWQPSDTSTTPTRAPNSPNMATQISLPDYWHRKGTEGGGDTEVWSTSASIYKIEAHIKRAVEGLQAAFPVGRNWNDWPFCGTYDPTDLSPDWQWGLPGQASFRVMTMRNYQTLNLLLTNLPAYSPNNHCK